MKKTLLTERFQQLAGIKSLYTEQVDNVSYEKVEFVYTEQGGHFYGLDVYENKDQDQRSAKLRYDKANEWLKDTLSNLDVDIPKRYGSGEKELDDAFSDSKAGFTKSKQDFIDKERELGRSID